LPAGTDAVIVHKPAPVVVPLAVPVVVPTLHGPIAGAEKLTGCPELDVALTVNPPPYCTPGNVPKLIVCDCAVEPCGRIVNVADTGLAAL